VPKDLTNQSVGETTAAAEQGRTNSTNTRDESIRVTLGRPESLPTVRDPTPATGTLVASAPSTNWKRGGEASTARAERESLAKNTTRRDGGRPARPAPREEESNSAPARSEDPDKKLGEVLAQTRERLDSISTYRVDITRVERVGGQLQTEEDVVLNVRRRPKAVLLQWAKGPSKGREVIYSTAINDRMMYVNMGNSALPLSRLSIPVDSPMVLRNSRHPISEAGFDTILDSLLKYSSPGGDDLRQQGKVEYKGIETPKGLTQPCHRLVRVSPMGETWNVFLDTATLMPALVIATQSSSGELIERYVYRNFRAEPTDLVAAEAFDPDKRWGEASGLLSRLARAAGAAAEPSPPKATR